MTTSPSPAAPSGSAPPAHRGPVTRRERSLAPDLARGSVLLFIALANVAGYYYGRPLEPGLRPVGGSWLDDALDVLVTAAVDRRSYPMFALLFGYGMVQLSRRQATSGASWPAVRRVLLRRNGLLVLLGAVHAALLFDGDVLGVYGGTGLVIALLLLRRSRAALVAWTAGTLVVLALVTGLSEAVAPAVTEGQPDYLLSVGERIVSWTLSVVLLTVLLALLGPMLIGVLMARAELLDRPWEHLTALRRTAAVGVPVGLLGGLPFALTVGGYWDPGTPVTSAVSVLHTATGVAAGVGYVALFGLWAARLRQQPRTRAVAALAATGERSLTCYLWQSLLLAPLLSAWGLGLGDDLGTTTAYALAVAVWASSVLVAVALSRAGRNGPAEALLRRLAYGRRAGRA